MSGRGFICLGAVLAGIGVALGALGAHLLKSRLSADQLASFETAVRYQMYHAIALIVVGFVAVRSAGGLLTAAASLFVLGIVLFSGGLYGWIFTGIKPFVHIVPIGGMSWIIAWLLFAWASWRSSL
jgi:uncharacterized membrane protein YgdD (TMEM256/DUF423 family)